MTWIYSPGCLCSLEPEASTSRPNPKASELSAASSGMPTPKAYSCPGCGTEPYIRPRSGMTCPPSTEDPGAVASMSFMAGFPARTSPSLASAPASATENEVGFGKSLPESWAKWDHDMSSWRMSQGSFFEELSESFLGTWPRSGLMLGGKCYQPPASGRRMSESESSLWATPQAHNDRAPGSGTLARGGVMQTSSSKRTDGERRKRTMGSKVRNPPPPITKDASKQEKVK